MISLLPLWFWRTGRKAFAIVAAYLIQVTVLPYFKVGGVSPDLVLCALVALAASMGGQGYRAPWRALVGGTVGLGAALLMEVTRKEPSGFTTVVCALAGAGACLVPAAVERRLPPGRFTRRRRERIMRFLPCVMIGAAALTKESLMVVYFYLRGVSISFTHIWRALLAALLNLGMGFAGYHLLIRWVYCMPGETWVAKAARRRQTAKRRRALRGIRKEAARRPAAQPGMEGGNAPLTTAPPLPNMRIKAKPIRDEDENAV
ncbi:MAG: hypothetical protein LBS11_10650 [Oscillospiraceae bacterium]|jgi:hypothetical protein|nr:hypothetical protein [Oscillospiraceae bacterium]